MARGSGRSASRTLPNPRVNDSAVLAQERRIDPEDGKPRTLAELLDRSKDHYTTEEILEYGRPCNVAMALKMERAPTIGKAKRALRLAKAPPRRLP